MREQKKKKKKKKTFLFLISSFFLELPQKKTLFWGFISNGCGRQKATDP
jgi:hypothetical protein